MAESSPEVMPVDDGRLWRFATGVYARDGVAATCLALQDDHGADVPLLLFAAWAAVAGMDLTAARMADAARSLRTWRAEVVTPLRTLRRRLKQGPPPAPGAITEGLRDRIKTAELEAERIALAALEGAAATWTAQNGGAPSEAAVLRNIALCFEIVVGHGPDASAADQLRRLAQSIPRSTP